MNTGIEDTIVITLSKIDYDDLYPVVIMLRAAYNMQHVQLAGMQPRVLLASPRSAPNILLTS